MSFELCMRIESLGDLPRSDKIVMLRGQLTLLRVRVEQGIPISIESVARAERVAHDLEAEEVRI